jgi:hypothetical protein
MLYLNREGLSSMRRLLRRVPFIAALGVVLAPLVASQVRAASVYEITVTVVDNTTSATHSFTAIEGTTNDVTDPSSPNHLNTINIGGAAWATFQTNTGLSLSGFNSVTNNPGTTVATISMGGTVQVSSSTNSDSYTVTTQVSQVNFASPVGPTGTLTNSESSTISNTSGSAGPPADSQSIQSWYDASNTLNGVPGTAHTPFGSYLLPATPNTTMSLSGPSLSTTFSPVTAQFSLTERVVVNITGNDGVPGFGAQSKDVFGGTLTLTALPIPEPSSIVMMLASMPLPLVIVGMLRRRAKVAG